MAEQGPRVASEATASEAAVAKLFCAERSFWLCDAAMQILGAKGYEAGSAVESMLRDTRGR